MRRSSTAAVALACLFAAPAAARTPTPSITPTPSLTLTPSRTPSHTFGPSPTATSTPLESPTPTATSTGTPLRGAPPVGADAGVASPALATPTSTPPSEAQAFAIALPSTVRSGQRVLLDGSQSSGANSYLWMQAGGDVAIAIEDADRSHASFVAPLVSVSHAVDVELTINGNRTSAPVRVTILPTHTIEVLLSGTFGPPGGTADMGLLLRPHGLGVTALTHDVHFDEFTGVAARDDGSPDCTAGESVDVDHAAFTFMPSGCTPGVSCDAVHAEVVARQAMQPETEVYTCRVALSEAPRASCQHFLTCAGGSGVASDGTRLDLDCHNGFIIADYFREAPQFSFRAEPPNPVVGDSVALVFTVAGTGGLPRYTLSGAEPVLHVAGPTPTPGGGPLSREVRYTTVADCPGTAPIQMLVSYEGRGGCPGAEHFLFKNAESPVYQLTVREAGTAVVRGRIGRYLQTCGGTRTAIVVLDPLGWRTPTYVDGSYSFGGLAPGEYTVRLETPCTPEGCYAPQPLTVDAGDSEREVVLCPSAALACAGDCNTDRRVDVAELVRGVQITLGTDDLSACPAADSNADESVAIDDLVRAINAALGGCAS